VRRHRSIVQLALVGLFALLVFPAAGSALVPTYTISLTSSGPSPALLSTTANYGHLEFRNTDSVSHRVTFANGSCSADVAPNDAVQCGSLLYVGHYPYTVDGTTQAEVVVEPAARHVSLLASRHAVWRGSKITLHGRLMEGGLGGPPGAGSPQRIIVIARPYEGHPSCRIGTVMATLHPPTKRARYGELLWHLRIRPRFGMTYVAIASYQPKGGQVWVRALSKPFRIAVRR
jgi:hypothetical protein